ncbi:MAG: DEAD/DEAH box helicase [Caldilineaceae bacterium]|nr:DEAD/DEAH box helicase [Caldilineaceae bacterium]MBP8107720.1 DEAD/DEAH box helicase [Caldilineaceae bacterium]MBP8122861.1 DEAD/DEAH box helicase [Caldilineaceae bacterium]MBP9071255.1 DEAD/DEAH box helicase [Caldilineaceae bacterium]
MKFSEFNLDPRINAAITAAGFSAPTPIQEQAIPHVLAGKDVMGLAQTGTGKTAAFMLPILQHLTKSSSRKIRALIVAPTRELAEQIHETAVQFGTMTRARSITVYGGVSKVRQVQQLRRGADIVVACPGRLLDIMGDKAIDLSGIEILVLDEADRMCDMGFLPDIRRILKALPTQRQTLFFSATMPDDIRSLSAEFLKNPVAVQIGIIAPAETVSHAIYPVTDGLKKPLLLEMLQKTATGRVLIFTRTKRRARNLAGDLINQGYNATALQGNMAQNRRQESINGFREGKYDILVATDIAARGIDVTEISHVINFDMPDTVDAYTHRIGRTGRAEQTGKAFTFSVHDDEAMVRDIEKTLGEPLERRALDGFNYSGFSIKSQDADVWAVARGSNGASRSSYNQARSDKARNSRLSGTQNGPAPSGGGNSSNSRRPRRRPYSSPGSRG